MPSAPRGVTEFSSFLPERIRDEFVKRSITPEFALESGVRYLADNELRRMGFDASLPVECKNQGLQGIGFEYRPINGSGPSVWRLKPDNSIPIGGKAAKYLSRKGDPARAYYPKGTTVDCQKSIKINVIITEGEFKALALAEKVCPIASRPTCVIGLNGVNGGWQRDKITKQRSDGSHETVKEGAAHLIPDLEEWEWAKRVVYIVFDSDLATKKHAAEFKRIKTSGAIGAEFTLAKLLRARGAEVRIVEIPHPFNGEKMGADDYITKYGPHAMLQIIYSNWVIERDIEAIMQYEAAGAVTFETAVQLVDASPAAPPFVLEGVLPVGGTMILAGAPGVGKSGVALNLAHAVASGEKFLGLLDVNAGRVAYIQAEIPRWAMARRVKSMGTSPDRLYLLNPQRLHLNYWEPEGFNKRRETGNREAVGAVVEALRRIAPTLVIFDPLANFHTLSENDVDAVRHLFEIFRGMAYSIGCGICIVHHNRKTARSESKYEGAEDMRGSSALFAEPDAVLSMYSLKRSDETFRYKLLFAKLRHSEPRKPLELLKWGQDSFRWEAQEWRDETTEGDKGFGIIDALRQIGSGTPKEIMHKTGMSSSSFYRSIKKLERELTVEKISGNVYVLKQG